MTSADTVEEEQGRVAGGGTPPPLGSRLGHMPVLHAVLARKILDSHLRNRNQLLDPPPSDLRAVPAAEARRLIQAMAAAAHADGGLDAMEKNRIRAALSTSTIAAEERRSLEQSLKDPVCLESLLRGVSTPQEASRFYAVSLAAVEKGNALNRAYLRYLALRLGLPSDLVVRLNRRFNMPV